MQNHPFPSSFVSTMKSQLGDDWDAFATAHELPTPVSIRFNPKKPIAMDTKAGVPWSAYGRYLSERPSFTRDPLFHGGAYYVQEASSMFLEQAFLQIGGDAADLTILDLCAAPGGKSTHLLSLMSAESMLVSNEVIRSRANILSENIQKWGYHNVIITSSDPQQFTSLESQFDIIVVDAPCSGEGMFRKDPDAIDVWSPDNVLLCARRQQRILDDIWPAVKNGGYLIYATCTYNEQEDEEQLSRLVSCGDAESVALQVQDDWKVTVVEAGGVQAYRFYPHKTSGEGLFMAVLRKTSGSLSPRQKASTELPRVAKPLEETIKSWVLSPMQYFMFKEDIRMIPPDRARLLNLLSRHLYLVNAGTWLGTSKHNKIIPSHAAALSVHLDQSHWSALEVDHETAIRYLRKEAIEPRDTDRGFALVKYQGLPLGWVNVLDTRANNLYPAEWRIRGQGEINN
jgi:16S rRNA C967 or C1407 C5-methylase (RsmB/RsmF family)/NOL1/NOP2/fmu family ribosome biogenesis protein